MVTVHEKLTACEELNKMIKAQIEDEVKAQKEYAELAAMARFVISEDTAGRIADSEVMSIAADEGKHEKMLRQLLEEIEKECVEPAGLGSLFG
jgi:NurA-like 5'-3' nuclease